VFAVDPKYLTCTVYLYPTLEAGQQGQRAGGTGFFVAFPAPDGTNYMYPYVVSNKHVIDGGCRYLRVPMRDGTDLVDEVPIDFWTFSPDDDLAVAPIGLPEGHDLLPFPPDIFLDEACAFEQWKVFPGDEVAFFGRFIGHDGGRRNRPVLRFGSIAMLPDVDDPIDFGTHKQVGFLVECRSLSGFSGSPAFLRLAQSRLVHPENDPPARGTWIPTGVRFLGVNCGHLPFYSPVREGRSTTSLKVQQLWAETNSGIAVVIPAWNLLALLNQEHLVEARRKLGFC